MTALPRRIIAVLLCLLAAGTARAAKITDVELRGLDEAMELNVRTALSAVDAIGKETSGRRLAYLLREAERETREALEPFGYYSATITVERTRDGVTTVVGDEPAAPVPGDAAATDPTTSDDASRTRAPNTSPVAVTITVQLGEPVTVRRADVGIDGEGAVVEFGEDFLHLGFHRLEIGDRDADFTEHLFQLFAQHTQFGRVGAAVDFQVHQRLMENAFAGAAFWQDFQQLALAATTHAEHGGLQGVDAVATAVQLGTNRVDQKWQVVVQHFDRGVGRLPAMTFVIGVVDAHLRLRVIEALKQAPRRKSTASEVRQPTLGQFIQGNDAEELFSEQRHLWQCLFTDVLRQCRLQLMLEVGLAGCGEERHLWYSAWACY